MTRTPARPHRRPGHVDSLRVPSGLEVQLTPAGDVRAIRAAGGLLVNQYVAGTHDVAPGGLHLRRTMADGTMSVPMVGARSGATHVADVASARWDGRGLGARWTVHLVLDPEQSSWGWRIDLVGEDVPDGATYDVAVLQDLSLSPQATAQTSEAYVSQYVAHRLERDPRFGRVVLSRQTMTTAPALPLVLTALVEGALAAGTDAFDLFTPRARSGGVPAFATGEPWPDRVRQHEMAMAGLLSHATDLAEPWTLHAVARFWPDHAEEMLVALDGLPSLADRLVELATRVAADSTASTSDRDERSLLATAPLLSGDVLSDADLVALVGAAAQVRYPERHSDGRLLSYFTADGRHVVRGEKDQQLDRPHGHVLLCGDALAPDRPTLSTTVFAHGVVGSHTVMGNTSFDRFVTVHRNHLNLLRSNGVRVLVRRDGQWQILGQPSAFVLDVGEARWLYRLGDAELEIRTMAAGDRPVLVTEVCSSVDLDVLVTMDVDLGDGAWRAEGVPDSAGVTALAFRADPGTQVAEHHDALTYVLAAASPSGAVLAGDGPVFADGEDRGSAVVTVRSTGRGLRIAVAADFDGGEQAAPQALAGAVDGLDAAEHRAQHRRTLGALTRDLHVDAGSRFAELATLLPWWAHDARVHFLVPHGLEQYSGAAWGTRDVCQGPLELLIAAGRHDAARDVLLRVFSRQSVDGTFPQWFMFDDYAEVLQEHAHGDVVVWPLFALGQYLRASGDRGALDEVVVFRDGDPATVREHVEAIITHMRTNQVPGTALPAYGEGDWDDTLQPARPEMRERMTSTWTSALTFQALTLLAAELAASDADLSARLSAMADELGADVRRLLLPDGIATGFATVENGVAQPLIHPRDTSTGLTYRLIAMTRPIIAEFFDDTEADRHERLVRENLHFPDGVRLINRPARFADGQVESFLRAEQAAFFGREVGLMYVHAHIRWVEALASLGRAAVGEELLRLSPIGMPDRVPSALPRQRTCYTSSSDATFPDRYSAADGFEGLRTGQVPTADGWRVYSSGPGIFIRQVLHGLLGLEERADVLVVDPSLAASDDGLEIELVVAGRSRRVRYHVDPAATGVEVRADGVVLPASPEPRRYRAGGAVLALDAIGDAPVLDVHTPPGS